jgi:hypothetical protein
VSSGPAPKPLTPSTGTHLSVSVYSPWILLDASRTRKVPSGVSRSFSFTSSLGDRMSAPAPAQCPLLLPTAPAQCPLLPPTAHCPCPVSPTPAHCPCPATPYLEMSPQYHSASCRAGALPPLAGPGLALDGLGGRAGDRMHVRRLLRTEAAPTPQHGAQSGVTWGRNLPLLQELTQQLLHQQRGEVGARLAPGRRGGAGQGWAGPAGCVHRQVYAGDDP